MILQARALLPDSRRWIEGGGLHVAGGRILRVLDGVQAVRRARARTGERVVDLGDGVLAPGWVNAHCHLELSALAGRLPRVGGFAAWIAAILPARRALDDPALAEGVRAGARRLLSGGTTTVGDIASAALSARAARAGLRSVVYREVLDAWNPARTEAALRRLRTPLRTAATRVEGVSPHAPYTTSDALLAGVGRIARRRRLPVTVHWAETEEEAAWLRRGAGPLARMLGPSPRASGLALLEQAGLLHRGVSLAHGNAPARGEPGRIASAGCVLVHCPGTHAFFARPSFPWARYARAGVRVALGTDSLASNEELDMRREMALARRAAPALAPERVFDMATVDAAVAVGLGRSVGRLRPGYAADLALHRFESQGLAGALEEATTGQGHVRAVWVQGRRVFST